MRYSLRRLCCLVLLAALAGCGAPAGHTSPTAVRVAMGQGGQAAASAPALAYDAASVKDQTGFVRYDDIENPFAMLLPGEWYLSPEKASEPTTGAQAVTVVSSTNPDEVRAGIQVVFVPVPAGARVNLPIEIAASEKTLAGSGASEITADAEHGAVVNGLRAEERVYNYRLVGDWVRQRSVFFASGAWFYTVSLVGPREAVERYNDLFTLVLSSFAERSQPGA